MLRTARTRSMRITATLLRSLLVGSTIFSGSVLVASTLTACGDESKPEYWIEKLEDKEWRPKAIERLSQFYEDALTNNKKDTEAPAVKALLDQLAAPLTKAYVDDYATLDEKTRENLINLLASFRDPRTLPALNKAFEEFGKRGRGGKDVKWASRAIRDMKPKESAAAVFAAFEKTKPSTKDGAYYRDLNEALLALKDPSWTPKLIEILDTDFPHIVQGKKPTPEQMTDLRDTAYLVITAAQILGEIGDAAAVKPLMMLVLDPTRSQGANEALLALTKIGKPSVDMAVKLLKDQDKELAEYHAKRIQKATGAKAPPTGKMHVDQAAVILGALGRPEAIAPLIEAIKGKEEKAEKVGLLNALAQLPHTPEVKAAFVEGYEDLDADTAVGEANASSTLAEAATLMFDPSMTDMLVKRAWAEKGDDNKITKSMIALAAIKTMGADDVRSVGRLVASLPDEKEGPLKKHIDDIKQGYELAKKMIDTCKANVDCYLKEAAKTENQSDKNQLAGIKALYMVGQLGNAAVADKVVEILPDLEKSSLRYIAAQVIDHHLPKGSAEIAKKLQDIVDTNAKSMDQGKASGDKPLRDALYRLQARAG